MPTGVYGRGVKGELKRVFRGAGPQCFTGRRVLVGWWALASNNEKPT